MPGKSTDNVAVGFRFCGNFTPEVFGFAISGKVKCEVSGGCAGGAAVLGSAERGRAGSSPPLRVAVPLPAARCPLNHCRPPSCSCCILNLTTSTALNFI